MIRGAPVTRACKAPVTRACKAPVTRACKAPFTRACKAPVTRTRRDAARLRQSSAGLPLPCGPAPQAQGRGGPAEDRPCSAGPGLPALQLSSPPLPAQGSL